MSLLALYAIIAALLVLCLTLFRAWSNQKAVNRELLIEKDNLEAENRLLLESHYSDLRTISAIGEQLDRYEALVEKLTK